MACQVRMDRHSDLSPEVPKEGNCHFFIRKIPCNPGAVTSVIAQDNYSFDRDSSSDRPPRKLLADLAATSVACHRAHSVIVPLTV